MSRGFQKSELCVGITSWNSERFLPYCIQSIKRTTSRKATRIVVLDNHSTDRSAALAAGLGAEVISRRCTQGDALNILLSASRSHFTLLIHSDVVMLSDRWLEVVARRADENATALVSPEDIGCGPYSRPFGKGMPESSLMFWFGEHVDRVKQVRWRRWHRLPFPKKEIDFYGDHVTHSLPGRLRAVGLSWSPMDVLISPEVPTPIYSPHFQPGVWSEELSYLKYGLGNFYSLDGVITHYHNWYDRADRDVTMDSTRTTGGNGFPLAYINTYTEAFLADYERGTLVLPPAVRSNRLPKAL